MRTVRLILEYEGTNYSGWQIQEPPPVVATVQGELEKALLGITQTKTRMRAASRTDSGVHARNQVVAFELEKDRPITAFSRGLNRLLPKDIVVRSADFVEDGWDPRHHSRGKRYRYRFWNDPQPTALDRRFTWHIMDPLDVDRMHAAAQHFIGSQDFEAFRSSGCPAAHAIRWMYTLTVTRTSASEVCFEVIGNAFCRNMVRIMAGTLRDVGVGRLSPDDIPGIIEGRDRTRAGMTAPPQGLCLEEVIYDDRLPPKPRS